MIKELLVQILKRDEKFNALAEVTDFGLTTVQDEIKNTIIYSRIDDLPEEVLDLLAWQFHVDFWRSVLPIELKRELVKNSIKWHRYKGTPWAVKKALEWFGIEAEIIEYWQARKKYEELGGIRLDGSWSLDGTKKLIPYYNITALSYMSNWAEFCVKLNLASMDFTGWDKLTKQVVNVAKNVRSWPVYVYFLSLEAKNTPLHVYSLLLKKQIGQPYPWCTKRLDGSWSLGTGGEPYFLDGSLKLDGGWKVGGRTPVYAEVALKQCNIFCKVYTKKKIQVKKEWSTLRLGLNRLRLDGGWKLGKNPVLLLVDKKVTKTFPINARPFPKTIIRQLVEIDYPASPEKLGKYPGLDGRRLNGDWKVGCEIFNRKLDGLWKIRSRKGIGAQSELQFNVHASSGLPTKLGAYPKLGDRWSYKLNGSWQIGAFKKVDGTWSLDGQAVLGARTVGWHYAKLDGAWRVGEATKKIDGTWVVGHNGPSLDIKFVRRAA